jgi:hypothetical protein
MVRVEDAALEPGEMVEGLREQVNPEVRLANTAVALPPDGKLGWPALPPAVR